jgi:N-acetylglucosamine-6-phosphate deacetylase
MASANPAKAVGIFEKTGSIEIGKAADFVLMDEQFRVMATFIDGREYKGE